MKQAAPNATSTTWIAWSMQILIILCVYSIWVLQPWYSDDWGRQWLEFSIPREGSGFSRTVASWYVSTVSPFSLFQPWAVLNAVSATALAWRAVALRELLTRSLVTLILILGFPYLGHVAPNPSTFVVYWPAVFWMALWLVIYHHTQNFAGVRPWHWPVVFAVSFMVAIWNEVFMVSFFGIVAYLFYDAWHGYQNYQLPNRSNQWLLALVVLAGYLLALLYYTNGNSQTYYYSVALNRSSQILNPISIANALVVGSKEIVVLLKDCLPLFMCAGYIKLKNRSSCQPFEKHYRLFLALSAGIFAFVIICIWILGVLHWRTRWPCAMVLIGTVYTIPESLWGPAIDRFRNWRWRSKVLPFAWVSAITWLAINALFTYGYTNIDVRGWLQYRQMVVDRNPAALDRLCCRTLPAGRPRGVAWWDHEWGAQDDRYRLFMAPDIITVRGNVRFFWGN